MKVIILSLLVCALASTALSRPVENEQLLPIGGPSFRVNPIILSLEKEVLLKVQDNLRAAGLVEEALHLNKFIKENEKIVEENTKNGVTHVEGFQIEDHLDGIYNVLEKYKKYLPTDSSLSKPEEDEQSPSLPGPALGVQVIILAAKEKLLKLQEILIETNRVVEALHLNKLIEENEKIEEKVKKGEIKSLEVFEVEDHLDSFEMVLLTYKNYLPVN